METIWFCLVAVMLAVYVVLDGFDLGAGIVHLLVARTDDERRAVLRSIGPVWDGNEVWLLAAGGTLYFAFPALYASSFSGFYLPLMMVLWLLILRGISIEFRNHVDGPIWQPFWDAASARERAAGDFLRRGAGQRGARRSARCHGAFSSRCGPISRLPAKREFSIGTPILIGVAALAGPCASRRRLARLQDGWASCRCARWRAAIAAVVARCRSHRRGYDCELPSAPAIAARVSAFIPGDLFFPSSLLPGSWESSGLSAQDRRQWCSPLRVPISSAC